jgi:ATP-binding cassette subfamily B protein
VERLRVGNLRSILKHFAPYRRAVIIGLASLLVVDGLQLLIPRIIKQAVDGLTAGTATGGDLAGYGMMIAALAAVIAALRFVWRCLIIGTSRHIEEDIRNRIFEHLLRLSSRYFALTKTGDLMAHATNDLNAVRMACGFGLVATTDAIILGVASIGFMLVLNVKLTLLALIPMPIIAFFTLRAGKLLHQRFERVQETFSHLMEGVRESIAGIRVVKAYVQEDHQQERLSDLGRRYIRRNVELVRIWGVFFPFVILMSSLSVVIVLFVGGRQVMLGTISTGDLVAFVSYLGILTWPMMAMGWVVNVLQRGSASMGRINRILESVPEIVDSERAVDLDVVRGEVEFRDVTFQYDDDAAPALSDVSFVVPAGSSLGVLGRTGSGKSTICNLLLRIFETGEGQVLLDGHNVKGLSLRSVRRAFGYVPQDTFLFSDTVAENIRFGSPDATDDDVRRAAEVASILGEIEELADGMDTLVGERGVTLSGGQKQRIAIARAIVALPSVIILDDALSSVDTATEEKIQRGLATVLQGRTSIIVSHRISSISGADDIIVFDGGRITERGTHQELLAEGGLYADIHQRQLLEEEMDESNADQA